MDQNDLQIPAEIRTFLEGLLNEANIQSLDENAREETIKELFVQLDNFMTTAIIDNMPPEYLDEFIKLNEEKKSQAEIEAFLKEKMPNAQEVFANAFKNFRNFYLGNIAVARNKPAQN